jgi:hypothetical protein
MVYPSLVGLSDGELSIMVKIPVNPNTTHFKLNAFEVENHKGPSIGMAELGKSCYRQTWYAFRWVKPISMVPGRVIRIFKLGHVIEDIVIESLEGIGIEVYARQQELWGFEKFIHGFIDGRCTNVPEAPKTEHLLEIKSMKASLFKKLEKSGVKSSNPGHYDQCQRYMHALGLKRALYVCMNKDTSEIYPERIYYDESRAKELIHKEQELVMSEDPPSGISTDPSWFECKFCNFHGICHHGDEVAENCRTCANCDLHEKATWKCGLDNSQLSTKEQELGCPKWKLGLPG